MLKRRMGSVARLSQKSQDFTAAFIDKQTTRANLKICCQTLIFVLTCFCLLLTLGVFADGVTERSKFDGRFAKRREIFCLCCLRCSVMDVFVANYREIFHFYDYECF